MSDEMIASLVRRVAALESQLRRPSAEISPTLRGTWTPQFAGQTTPGTFTYATNVGYYRVSAGWCDFYGYLEVSAMTVAPAGDMVISGLPFPSPTFAPVTLGYINKVNVAAATLQMTAYIEWGSSFIRLLETYDALNGTRIQGSSFGPCGLIFGGSYAIS